MERESYTHIYPQKITMYGDLTIERVETKINFPEISQISFTQSFQGAMIVSVTFITDLNIKALKRSQIGYVEGIMSEAFNMLAQEIILNICDHQSLSLIKLPAKARYNFQHDMISHSVYRLNMTNGYCHCGINIQLGGKK